MKTKKLFSRHNLLLLIILCYLLPLIAIISYNMMAETGSQDWMSLSLGLFTTFTGTLLLFYAMTYWEASFDGTQKITISDHNASELPANHSSIDLEDYKLTKLSLDEAQQMQVRLLTEIDNLTDELQSLKSDKSQVAKMSEQYIQEKEEIKKSAEKQLEEQQLHIRDLHEAIAEHKAQLEKKHHQVSILESKVGDLTYEIKTLLNFAEAHSGSLLSSEPSEPPPKPQPAPYIPVETLQQTTPNEISTPKPIQNSQEGSQLLKRCLDISQKITGSQRFGSQLYTFSESPAESFTLDLRRLCDRLRSDIPTTNSTVLLYSPKESQLLFASNQVRDQTGWSPEKFIQTFSDILQDEGMWKQGVNSLSMRSEAQIQLPIKTRSGHQATFQTHLGTIPTGIFRNHIIAILTSPASAL